MTEENKDLETTEKSVEETIDDIVDDMVEEKPVENKQQNQLNITVQDIRQAYNAIDIAAKRGAYKAEDIAGIGPVVQKLRVFIMAMDQAEARARAQMEENKVEEETTESVEAVEQTSTEEVKE